MASKKAYVDHLKRVPLFAACTRKELELIARSGDEIQMTAGTVLVDQGQTGHEAFVVLDGKVLESQGFKPSLERRGCRRQGVRVLRNGDGRRLSPDQGGKNQNAKAHAS